MNKLEKLRAALADKDIDALIVLDELNQRYLSDFAFTDGLLLITATRAELITDFRYYEMAEKSANKAFNIVMPENRTEYIANIFAECSTRVVGFEGRFVPYDTYNSYRKKYPSVEFVDIGSMIENIREIKTPDEILTMQKAQDITDAAFSHILKVMTPNMTEIEVAAELEYVMRKLGAESVAFDTIAVSGDASALPHGTPRNCKLKPGFLTMDYGAKYNGYCSDMTRTVVLGKADAEMKKLYNTVLEAQTAALAFLKEGVACRDADTVARDIINKAGYEGRFGHSLGHGVGMYIHESPRLSQGVNNDTKLARGHVVTVEPGIYIEGLYGCRIEDMVGVLSDGTIYDFTNSPKEMIELF